MKSLRKHRKFKKHSKKRGGMFPWLKSKLGMSAAEEAPTQPMVAAAPQYMPRAYRGPTYFEGVTPAHEKPVDWGYPAEYKPTREEWAMFGPFGPGPNKPEFSHLTEKELLPNGGVPFKYIHPDDDRQNHPGFIDYGNGAYVINETKQPQTKTGRENSSATLNRQRRKSSLSPY